MSIQVHYKLMPFLLHQKLHYFQVSEHIISLLNNIPLIFHSSLAQYIHFLNEDMHKKLNYFTKYLKYYYCTIFDNV